MKKYGMSLGDRFRHVDPILFICTTLLSFMSILTIYGAVDNFGKSKLTMQIAMTLAGMVALFIVANIDYRFFVDRFAIVMFLASVFLLALTLLFGSTGENMETANRSWIRIPIVNIAVQPSEFVKIAFLCTFSKHIDVVKEKINKPLTLLGLLLHAGVIVGLILISGDLGVALVYIGIILIMLFCAGLNLWYFLGLFGAFAAVLPILWSRLEPYQRERILVGFHPERDPLGYGYQPLLSRDAMMSGGFFGKGIAGGEVYVELPASHTDFIYATVCEKLGFVGGLIVLLTLVVFILRIFMIASRSERGLGAYLCVGLAACLIIQIIENVGMCFAVLPVVGITLPFVSYGGSSVLGIYLMAGMVHSVACHRNRSRRFWS